MLPPLLSRWYSTESRSMERYGISYSANILRTDQQNSHHSSANSTTGLSGSCVASSRNASASAGAAAGFSGSASAGGGGGGISKR